MLYDILKNKKCFKLICGAGNEDTDEVERLVYIYSLAGCQFFDVCAKSDVIDAAKKGLKLAGNIKDRYICISVGSESDQHFCKAEIDSSSCTLCGKCKKICPQNAIKIENNKYLINQTRCIGCKRCVNICTNSSINLITKKTDYKELLPELTAKKLDCIEFHIAGDENDIKTRWKEINSMFDGTLSISINRAKLGDEAIIELIKSLVNSRKPYTTIIQADGVPMSGGEDDNRTTLQAISTADMFISKNIPAFVIVSGGTNSKTGALAKHCGVDIDGVAIGSFARKLVKEYTSRDDFYINEEIKLQALNIAKKLVNSSIDIN